MGIGKHSFISKLLPHIHTQTCWPSDPKRLNVFFLIFLSQLLRVWWTISKGGGIDFIYVAPKIWEVSFFWSPKREICGRWGKFQVLHRKIWTGFVGRNSFPCKWKQQKNAWTFSWKSPLEVDWWLERWSSHYSRVKKCGGSRRSDFCRMKNPFHNFFFRIFFAKKRDQLLTEMGFGTAPRNLRNHPNLVDRYGIIRENGWGKQQMYKFAKF